MGPCRISLGVCGMCICQLQMHQFKHTLKQRIQAAKKIIQASLHGHATGIANKSNNTHLIKYGLLFS